MKKRFKSEFKSRDLWFEAFFKSQQNRSAEPFKSLVICDSRFESQIAIAPNLGHTPSTAGTFRKKFRKDSGKTPETLSERFPGIPGREYGWDAPNPIIQGIWGFQSISRISSPPVRLGALLFSEVVPERASQSRSWNSQQYWGYFWKSRDLVGTGKRGHYERGLFTGGISRISKFSKFSRFSRKWSDSPLLSTVSGISKISRISKFFRVSRKWTFLKRPLFQKTPFSEPDLEHLDCATLSAPHGHHCNVDGRALVSSAITGLQDELSAFHWLSGPTATVILSRYTVALHSVALPLTTVIVL